MSVFRWVRDILGIGKDRVEKKKARLEIERLKKEAGEKDRIVESAMFGDVKKYDPKTKKIIDKIEIETHHFRKDKMFSTRSIMRSILLGLVLFLLSILGLFLIGLILRTIFF